MEEFKPRPRNRAVKDIAPLRDEATAFMAERGISKETLDRFQIKGGRAFFPELDRENQAIVFPYIVNGNPAGEKLRSWPEKSYVVSSGLRSPFGLQRLDMGDSDTITIVEGEMDVLSFDEAGIGNSISVPNGAQTFSRITDDMTDEQVYGFLWPAKEQLDKAKRIIIATDMDEPGRKLGDELARRVGKERCWKVEYPAGCKDANDVLLKYGPADLIKAWEDALPWPVEGIFEPDDFYEEVDRLYKEGFANKISTGMNAVDELYSCAPGLLTIITGVPSSGKSQFVDQIMVNLARREDYTCAVCSFENPPSIHIGKLAEVIAGKHFFETDTPGPRMSFEEYESIKPFISKHFKFLHQETGSKSTIESIIERIKIAVLRWGVRAVIIDPMNFIERPKSAESETSWIDDMLTRLRMLAVNLEIHIWLVAHPTKLPMNADGTYAPPGGYSIAGSASFYSKADFGLTVHRDPASPGLVKIINWKTRFAWLGKQGTVEILYSNTEHRYLTGNFDGFL